MAARLASPTSARRCDSRASGWSWDCPATRSPARTNDCSGSYSFNRNARIQSGVDSQLAVGADVLTQSWMRDPQSPSATRLSDWVHFEIAP